MHYSCFDRELYCCLVCLFSVEEFNFARMSCISRMCQAQHFTRQHHSFDRKLENPHKSGQHLVHTKTQHSTKPCGEFPQLLLVPTVSTEISHSVMFSPTSYIIISNLNQPQTSLSPKSPQPFQVWLYQLYYHALWFDEKTHASNITRRLSFHYRHYRPSRNSKQHALLRHFWAALSFFWV